MGRVGARGLFGILGRVQNLRCTSQQSNAGAGQIASGLERSIAGHGGDLLGLFCREVRTSCVKQCLFPLKKATYIYKDLLCEICSIHSTTGDAVLRCMGVLSFW